MPMDANIQAIVMAHPEISSWIYSQFVQLWGCSPEQEDFFVYNLNPEYWYGCPYIQTQEVHKEILLRRQKVSIIDYIIQNINCDSYIVMPVDTYYINAYNRKSHYPHEMMVYGYDMEKEEVFIADFFSNHYSFSCCSFRELISAVYASGDFFDWHNIIRLATIDYEKKSPKHIIGHVNGFDFTVVTQLLQDYIDGVNSQLKYRIPHVTGDWFMFKVGGVNVYNILNQYAIDCFENKKHIFDFRPFYVIKSHKDMMMQRFLYTKSLLHDDMNNIITDYKTVMDLANIAFQKSIKLSLNVNASNGTLIELCTKLRKTECAIYQRYIDVLIKNNDLNPIYGDEYKYKAKEYNEIS